MTMVRATTGGLSSGDGDGDRRKRGRKSPMRQREAREMRGFLLRSEPPIPFESTVALKCPQTLTTFWLSLWGRDPMANKMQGGRWVSGKGDWIGVGDPSGV